MNKFLVSFQDRKVGRVTATKTGLFRYKSFQKSITDGFAMSPIWRAEFCRAAEFLTKETAAVACNMENGVVVAKE